MRSKTILAVIAVCAVLCSYSALAVETKKLAAPAAPVIVAVSAVSAPAVQPVQGEVHTTAPAPTAVATPIQVTAADYVEIQLKPQTAKYKMQQFALTLHNKQAAHIDVMQLEVLNGMDEQSYLQIQQTQSQAKRRMAGGLLRGVTGLATSFVPYAGMGSYAAYQALGAGNQAMNVAANMVENSAGAANVAGRIIQRANNILVSPNQDFQCLVAVPENQAPVVKVIFKDLQTNQIFELQK